MDGRALFHEPIGGRPALAAVGRRGVVSAAEDRNDGLEDGATLILAVAAGDRAAFALLFTHYAPRVKTYLLRRGAGVQRAEELAQEALLSVWRKAGQFDPLRASPGAWIFTIARNLGVDDHRRARPVADALADDPSAAPEPPAAADARLDAAERDQRLREAVRALPADQLAVVRLSFFSDKPHAEIAAELGVPLGTVKSRLRLAFVRLRAGLEDFR